MQIIPLQAVSSQTVNVALSGQNCNITIFQTAYGLFCDLYIGSTLIIGGVICENLNRIVRDAYLGFVGDLCFQDTQGSDDPIYTGLGIRFLFCYLEQADLSIAGFSA